MAQRGGGGGRADGSQGLSTMHPASPDIYPVRGQSVRANIGRTWNFGYILRDSSGGAAERSEKQFRSLRCLLSRPRRRRRRGRRRKTTEQPFILVSLLSLSLPLEFSKFSISNILIFQTLLCYMLFVYDRVYLSREFNDTK